LFCPNIPIIHPNSAYPHISSLRNHWIQALSGRISLNTNQITKPPKAVRKAKLDTLALVPASLLFRKGKYRTIANNLPGRGVLICEADKKERIAHILERVAAFFRQRGYFVRILPYSLL
jgi:hypothetical protein